MTSPDHGVVEPTAPSAGTEFRDDRRRRRPLPADVLARLTIIDPFKATLAVIETVGLLAAAIALAIWWWTPWVVVPAIVVIAARQQACFVLAHEAAHYRLYRTRWLNELVGRALGTAVGISMCTYRVVHRLHHNHLYRPEDPDMALVGGYPRGRAYLTGKLLKDLAGLTAPKTYAYFFGAPAINDDASRAGGEGSRRSGAVEGERARPLDDTAPHLRRAARRDRWLVVSVHVVAPSVAFAAGFGVEYLVLWVLPAVTVLQAFLRFRAICEHGAVIDTSSPLTAARTNLTPWWLGWLLFPHHVNYHVEHHLYPAIPHYHLPACHRALAARDALQGAEVRRFEDTVRRVFARRRDRVAAVI